MLPSPAWPKVPISTPCRSAIGSTAVDQRRGSRRAARRRRRAASRRGARAPDRPGAERPCSIRPSASSSEVTTRSAPASSQHARHRGVPVGHAPRPSSDAGEDAAPRRRGRGPIGWNVLDRADRRAVHQLEQRRPAAAHDARDRVARRRRASGSSPRASPPRRGGGSSRTVASVTTPSVPSEPHEQPDEVVAGDALARARGRARTARPSASTTSSPSSESRVTPYFTQHSPPALVATLPPIVENSQLAGSGAYQSPCFRGGRGQVRVDDARPGRSR